MPELPSVPLYYSKLVACVDESIAALDEHNHIRARHLLVKGLEQAEETYIEMTENPEDPPEVKEEKQRLIRRTFNHPDKSTYEFADLCMVFRTFKNTTLEQRAQLIELLLHLPAPGEEPEEEPGAEQE